VEAGGHVFQLAVGVCHCRLERRNLVGLGVSQPLFALWEDQDGGRSKRLVRRRAAA
jgi:hypothetical protein